MKLASVCFWCYNKIILLTISTVGYCSIDGFWGGGEQSVVGGVSMVIGVCYLVSRWGIEIVVRGFVYLVVMEPDWFVILEVQESNDYHLE